MPKNKLKDSFYWLDKNGRECDVNLLDKPVAKRIKEVKEYLKKVPSGKADFMYISAKESLIAGFVNEKDERFIFVARDYWEADYVPGCGWIKVEDEDEIS